MTSLFAMTHKTRNAALLLVASLASVVLLLASPAHAQSTSTGGASIGSGGAEGASGGGASVVATPTAVSGSSGEARAGSSSTNTGDTGPAYSEAYSAPLASSGASGSTGASGPVSSNPTAVNTEPLGTAIAVSPNQTVSGASGASAAEAAVPVGSSGSSGGSSAALSAADVATVTAASQPVAIDDAIDVSGSSINFSRSVPSTSEMSALTNVALVAVALLFMIAATVTGTRLGRRFGAKLDGWGPKSRTT
jgi:hypothetical protein